MGIVGFKFTSRENEPTVPLTISFTTYSCRNKDCLHEDKSIISFIQTFCVPGEDII